MTIHSMSARARSEATYGSAEDMYHDLRAQGVPAAEAWRRVRDVFAAPAIPGTQPPDLEAASRADLSNTSVNIHGDNGPTAWEHFGWGPLVLVTVLWLLEQTFWALVWMIRFTVRVAVGLLWFALGVIVGFGMFSRR
jgi:hypothetical protein